MASAVSIVLAPIHRNTLASASDRRGSDALPRDPLRLLLFSLRSHGGPVPARLEPNHSAREVPSGIVLGQIRIVLASFHRNNPADFRHSFLSGMDFPDSERVRRLDSEATRILELPPAMDMDRVDFLRFQPGSMAPCIRTRVRVWDQTWSAPRELESVRYTLSTGPS